MRLTAQAETGLPVVTAGGVPLVETAYVFWGKDWRWAGTTVPFDGQAAADGRLAGRMAGRVDDLGVGVRGDVEQTSDSSVRWRWRFTTAAELKGVIGGGFSFRLFHGAGRQVLGEPELDRDGRGWTWGRGDLGRLVLRFETAPRELAFERGQKNEIRAYVYKDVVGAGPIEVVARLSLEGPDVGVEWSDAQRLRPVDTRQWRDADGRLPDGPLDLSSLNESDRPAGRHGRITARGERLFFGDGREARLWGTNLTAGALFQTHPSDVRREAKRLARMGYNLVRLHHHDSQWVDPNIFGIARRFDTREINERMARQIDWWIKCLRDEGIYLWLDLHVGRQVREQDGITAYSELAKGANSADLRGYNYVNPSLHEAMWTFARDYLSRKNVHTDLSPIDDPAVAFVLITNENDLTTHFGNALLGDKNVPWHHERFRKVAAEFAGRTGLPIDRLMQTWLPGPSKVLLNDLEYRVHQDTIQRLRKLGLKALVASTNFWGDSPQVSLPALTVGDVVDVHTYSGSADLRVNPAWGSGLFDAIARGTVEGRPTVVSEWNIDATAAHDRHALPLMVAARAAHQGVSAMLHYAHTQSPPLGQGGASQWEAYSDPVFHDLMPLAALIYRTGLVRQASERFVYAPKAQEFFDSPVPESIQAAQRTAARLGKLVVRLPRSPYLPWSEGGGREAAGPGTSLVDGSLATSSQGKGSIQSLTGELVDDWGLGRFAIQAPGVRVRSGWLDERFASDGIEMTSATPHATLAAVSLDGQPIERSGQIVVAISGRAVPQPDGRLPYRVEPAGAVVRWAGREYRLGTQHGLDRVVLLTRR